MLISLCSQGVDGCMSVGTAKQPFFFSQIQPLFSFCLPTNICHLHLRGACVCVHLHVLLCDYISGMSAVGSLTPWDWYDPELSDLCLSSTYTHTHTHKHGHTRTHAHTNKQTHLQTVNVVIVKYAKTQITCTCISAQI